MPIFDNPIIKKYAQYKNNNYAAISNRINCEIPTYVAYNCNDNDDEMTDVEKAELKSKRLANASALIALGASGVEFADNLIDVVENIKNFKENKKSSEGTDTEVEDYVETASNQRSSLKNAISNYEKNGNYDGLKASIAKSNGTIEENKIKIKELQNETALNKAKESYNVEQGKENDCKNALEVAENNIKNYESGEYAAAIAGKNNAQNLFTSYKQDLDNAGKILANLKASGASAKEIKEAEDDYNKKQNEYKVAEDALKDAEKKLATAQEKLDALKTERKNAEDNLVAQKETTRNAETDYKNAEKAHSENLSQAKKLESANRKLENMIKDAEKASENRNSAEKNKKEEAETKTETKSENKKKIEEENWLD